MTIERFRDDFAALLAGCRVSVSQAGYNTVLDILAARARAVLVPFAAERETEQLLRAERLAARGAAELVRESELTPAAPRCRHRARGGASAGGGRARHRRRRPLGPAHRRDDPSKIVRRRGFCASGEPGYDCPMTDQLRVDAAETAGWPDLVDELDRWGEAGRVAPLWWRDDDAVAATPQLDALLALAGEVPLALAVIPARARFELADALARRPRVAVLQHGWRHANRAAGGRKSEYPEGRPAGVVGAEIAAGQARLKAMFGPRALPVLVPPWNRIRRRIPAAASRRRDKGPVGDGSAPRPVIAAGRRRP